MGNHMLWEPLQVRGPASGGLRRALFYRITHGGNVYRVMLGVDERGSYELLEHHVADQRASQLDAYRLLPYLEERNARGADIHRFATLRQAQAHVERRIREWEVNERAL